MSVMARQNSNTSFSRSGNNDSTSLTTITRKSLTSDTDISSDISANDVVQRRRWPAENIDEDDVTQIILSVLWGGGKLGLAYYDADTCQVYMMMDIVESEDFQILQRVKQQILPTTIITSSKMDERLLQALSNTANDLGEAGHQIDNAVDIQILPSIEFSLEISKRKILSLNLPCIPEHYTENERVIYMSSLVPFEQVNMIRSMGALLKYLDKKRIGVELEDQSVRVPVLALKTFSLDNMLMVDDNTFTALQIFQKELHPSIYKFGGSGAKEGLSLYGIMNRTKSVLASRLLRLWFMRPIQDIDVLKERQAAVAFFVSPRNIEVLTSLQDALRNIKNVARILGRMKTAQASVGDWQALYKTAYNAIFIGDICRAQTINIAIFKKIGSTFTEELHRIANLISKIVDFDESVVLNKFVVKPNIDQALDEKKRTYNGLPDFMTKVAREELKKLSDDIKECNVVYLPQLGYLLAIPRSPNMKDEKDFHMQGLDFVFQSNNMVHYKSASTRELDAILGDTQCEITDHETGIMHRLQNTILEHCDVLYSVLEYAAELDCLISLAICAKEYNYNQPTLTTENVIDIEGGRHPLQELCVTPFVPNTTKSGGQAGKMKFLTGPNSSGKSVYMKQVGLIVFLAHIGSFVPSESAHIGMCDRICTRIHTRESVSVGLSTFMIDINQMSVALRCASSRSLVLVDEFGKGTETVDGIALLCACLQFWLDMGVNCPHVLVSSHFHSIIHQHLLTESNQLTFQTMEVLHENNDLVFLYQLIDGCGSCSYAHHIARVATVPEDIVVRAEQVLKLLQEKKPIQRPDSAEMDTQLQHCQSLVTTFLQLQLDTDDVQAFLTDVVMPMSQQINKSIQLEAQQQIIKSVNDDTTQQIEVNSSVNNDATQQIHIPVNNNETQQIQVNRSVNNDATQHVNKSVNDEATQKMNNSALSNATQQMNRSVNNDATQQINLQTTTQINKCVHSEAQN
ncbi:mutS protein homolog 5-like [Glandiceps talaboti]